MSNVPCRPVVTEGDPKQKPSGCNITQPASHVSANQRSAAQIAANGQDAYAAYQTQNEAWRKVTERRQSEAPKGRMLRPDEIE
jgi:hypothetical protein